MELNYRLIDDAEVQRLIGLSHGLVTGAVSMTEGDLLIERIKIERMLLPATHTDAVYAQICEAVESPRIAPVSFVIAVLVPLISTRPLANEQLGHLWKLLENSRGETEEAAYSLCRNNASEMELLVATEWSNVRDVIGVYAATRSAVLLERLLAEASKTLGNDRYQSERYLPDTKHIFAAILKNPPERPSLPEVLLRLLQSSKPDGLLRDHLEAIIAETGDIELLLPLLLAFEADQKAYQNRYLKRDALEENIKRMRQSQGEHLASFPLPEAAAIRDLFEILRACQALPHRSDHARLQLRRKAVAPARTLLGRAASVLAGFADVFAADDEGQTDLVYIICCLPRSRALSFLRSELKRADLSHPQHAAFAVALSYAAQDALPAAAQESALVAPPDASVARTWWGDEGIERTCHEACGRSAVYLGRVFESSPKSHEERLTGMFLGKLQTELQHWAKGVEAWATKKFGRYSRVHCSHEDVAANGPEKVWGADIGFYLRVRANGLLTAERAFLAQAKKASVSAQGRELSWTMDRVQRDILIGQSLWSVYFLYGCHKTGNGIRVVPASAVRDMMAGASAKTRISASNAVMITRPFADFFTYDFLADWWGDCDGRALDIVRGRSEDFAVRTLFSIDVNLGAAG